MQNKLLSILGLAACTQSLLIMPVFAGNEFPGMGSEKDWVKAAHVYDRGLSLRKRGNIDQAMTLYEEAIKIYPYDPDFYYNLAIHYARDKNNFDRAESLIGKAIELKPQDYLCHWEKAAILLRQGKIEEAKTSLEQARPLTRTAAQQSEYDSVLAKIDEQLRPEKQ